MAKLVGISGITAGREFQVGELCVLGRSPNAQVRLPDLAVSRQHAKITRLDNSFIIEDLESSGGTRVNGQRITTTHLKHNDEIAIAAFRFRFVDAPLERIRTADFAVVCNESESHVFSVDASLFTRFQPVAEDSDVITISKLTRRLNAILAVGQASSNTLDSKALLDKILHSCLEFFPSAGRSLVAVPDREIQTLVVLALAMREGFSMHRFSFSRTVLTEVLYKGHSVISEASYEELDPMGSRSASLPPQSIMVAPLICQGQMLGLIYIDSLPMAQPFSDEDLEVLTSMAAHLALALHSAHLHETLLRQSRTEQELSAAHEVQKRFLPRGVPKMPGFAFVAHYDPCRDVGGDLYDFIPLGANKLGIAIGDVSGKGFPAALVMAWVASQLRVAAHQEQNPSDVVSRLNESLIEAHQDDLFVTLFYGVLDRLTMTIRFCNAGHVPPLLFCWQKEQVEVIEGEIGLPVGMVSGASFVEKRIPLTQGDIIMLVTDGVTEAMNPKKRMFGISGLFSAMAHSYPSATSMVSNVLSELRAFVSGETQYDDITIVAIESEATYEDEMATIPPGSMNTDTFKALGPLKEIK